jgi:hypothetical protein
MLNGPFIGGGHGVWRPILVCLSPHRVHSCRARPCRVNRIKLLKKPLSRSQQQRPPMTGPSERCLPIVATRHPARSSRHVAPFTIVCTHNKVMPSKLCGCKGCSGFNKNVRNVEMLEKCIFTAIQSVHGNTILALGLFVSLCRCSLLITISCVAASSSTTALLLQDVPNQQLPEPTRPRAVCTRCPCSSSHHR